MTEQERLDWCIVLCRQSLSALTLWDFLFHRSEIRKLKSDLRVFESGNFLPNR